MNPSVRLRAFLVALAGAVMISLTASQADRIFESSYQPWIVMLIPFAALAVGFVIRRLPIAVRVVIQALVALGIIAAVLSSAGGDVPGDMFASTIQGISSVLGARWPVPEIPIPVTAIAALVAIASAVAVELALSGRFAAAVLLPPIALLAIFALLASEAGPPSPRILVVLALGSLAILRLATLAHADQPDQARGAPQAAERRSLWTIAVLGITAATVGVVPAMLAGSLPDDDRYDPREQQQGASVPLDLVSPLARLDEWRGREPADVVFSSSEPAELRWRLVALTRYDGRTWMPPDDYRKVGRQLQEQLPTADERKATVTLGALDANWLPVPGRVLTVSESVLLDGGIGGLLVPDRLETGATYDVTYQPDGIDDPADISAINAAKHTDVMFGDVEIPPEIATLATRITQGAETDLRRAQRIAEFLITDYQLDPDAPAGHSIGILDLFLNDVKRGRDEQFVAAFALLADSIGLPVRVAVGFNTKAAPTGGTQAMSSDVTAWPEVEFDGIGWVPFDPIPEPTPTGGGAGTEVVSPAPVDEGRAPPTSAPSAPSTSNAEDSKAALGSATGVIESPLGRLFVLMGIIVLIAVLYVVIVLRLKASRRGRRRRSPASDVQVVGAFRSSIDTLVDLGAKAPSHRTDRELVLVGQSVIDGVAPELEPLAESATRAVYDGQPPTSEEGVEAWEQVRSFERETRSRVGRWRWAKAKISLRSLRNGLPDTKSSDR
jgi:transglutaminase-like putative cysteine protease